MNNHHKNFNLVSSKITPWTLCYKTNRYAYLFQIYIRNKSTYYLGIEFQTEAFWDLHTTCTTEPVEELLPLALWWCSSFVRFGLEFGSYAGNT